MHVLYLVLKPIYNYLVLSTTPQQFPDIIPSDDPIKAQVIATGIKSEFSKKDLSLSLPDWARFVWGEVFLVSSQL